jgi:hypothetical protein
MSDFSVKRRITTAYVVCEGGRENVVHRKPDIAEETEFLKKGTPVEFFDRLAHSRLDWNTQSPDVGIVLGLSEPDPRTALKILRLPDRLEIDCIYLHHIRPIDAKRHCDISRRLFSVDDYVVVTGELPYGIEATLGSANAWTENKAKEIGRKFQVLRICHDGDILLRDIDEFWSPEYLRKATAAEIANDEHKFSIGDLVVCETEHESDGTPGWNSQMSNTIGLIGTVESMRDGLYGIKYQNYRHSYTYREEWLRRATSDEQLVFDRLKTAVAGLSDEQQELARKSDIVDSVIIGKRRRA